ncbi:hypothetical protein LXL04_029795 [Taraxacum kok-saghyz]
MDGDDLRIKPSSVADGLRLLKRTEDERYTEDKMKIDGGVSDGNRRCEDLGSFGGQWLSEKLSFPVGGFLISGAARPNFQVVDALGTDYFEHLLPDIIQNCSHQRSLVRDGYLTLFKYLSRSLGVKFQNYLQQVLPAILDGKTSATSRASTTAFPLHVSI